MSDTLEAPVPQASEPSPPAAGAQREPGWRQHALGKYSLLLVWLVMATFFWFAVPNGLFHTSGTFHSIFGSMQAMILMLLGMSAMTTLAVGEFDLSFAAVMGMSASTTAVLGGLHGVDPLLACAAGLGVALVAGAVNAFFVVVLGVSSFVVTLGMGTVLMGAAEMITRNNFVAFTSPGLKSFATTQVLSMPIGFYYGVGVALALAYVIAWTPVGRSAAFIGSNPEVAKLAGIRVGVIRFAAYLQGALLAGFAGILVVGSVGSFDNSTTNAYLLPALAAVFLGTAVISPGSFNPIGTLIAIYFLQTGILGLQLMGSQTWVQNVFYGGGLVVAVTVAKLVRDRATTR